MLYTRRVFNVAFNHFWDNFSPSDSIFYELVQDLYPNVQIVKPDSARIDLEITSTFTTRYQYLTRKLRKVLLSDSITLLNDKDFFRDVSLFPFNSRAKRRIWYTGENIRPPLDSRIDGYLSFDQDNYMSTNLYFPLWQLNLRDRQTIYKSVQLGEAYPAANFLKREKRNTVPPKFACAFMSNLDPYRIRAIEALRQFGEVDVYGKRFGKFVPKKALVAKEYKFMLAFENDFFPGYVTEKLFDAYASNCVPLYWGSLGTDELINRMAFINVSDFRNLGEFAKNVGGFADEDWLSIYHQPLLRTLPDFQKVQQFLLS